MEVFSFFILFGILFGGWVYRDAKSRSNEWAYQWSIGTMILFAVGFIPGVVAFGVYLYKRNTQESSNSDHTPEP